MAFNLNGLLRNRKTLVHHHLVVLHKLHLTLVLWVEVVLAGREVIFFFSKGGGVRVFTIQKRSALIWIHSQLVEERILTVTGTVHGSEAATILGNVGVSTVSVVGVDFWL